MTIYSKKNHSSFSKAYLSIISSQHTCLSFINIDLTLSLRIQVSTSLSSLCGFYFPSASSWNSEFYMSQLCINNKIRVDYLLSQSYILSCSFKQSRFVNGILSVIPEHKWLLDTILLARFFLLFLVPLFYLFFQHLKRFIVTQTSLSILFIYFWWRIYLAIQKIIHMTYLLTLFVMTITVWLLFSVFQLPELFVPFNELIAGLPHNFIHRTDMQSIWPNSNKNYFSWCTLSLNLAGLNLILGNISLQMINKIKYWYIFFQTSLFFSITTISHILLNIIHYCIHLHLYY